MEIGVVRSLVRKFARISPTLMAARSIHHSNQSLNLLHDYLTIGFSSLGRLTKPLRMNHLSSTLTIKVDSTYPSLPFGIAKFHGKLNPIFRLNRNLRQIHVWLPTANSATCVRVVAYLRLQLNPRLFRCRSWIINARCALLLSPITPKMGISGLILIADFFRMGKFRLSSWIIFVSSLQRNFWRAFIVDVEWAPQLQFLRWSLDL